MTKPYEVFESLNDFRLKYGFANIIPLKHVATTLFLSQATIKNKIRQGEEESRLKGVKIEKDYFVFAESVQGELQIERDYHNKTISFLLENLDQGETHLDYSTGMDLIGLRHEISSDRTKYAKILGRISDATNDICECLITVIVHSKGKGIPSKGFFGLAEYHGYEWSDDEDFTKSQTKRVLKKLEKIKKKLPAKMEEMFGL